MIVAPFITKAGAEKIINNMPAAFRSRGTLSLITDLSPAHVSDGSIEPSALVHLMDAVTDSELWHVPKLHAKVYMADLRRAIVTSGNLTAGAFFRNVEYGLDIADESLVASINSDLSETRFFGVLVQVDQLRQYTRVAAEVRQTYQRQENNVDLALKQTFLDAIRTAEDDLIRLRLGAGAMHTVFAKSILYILRKHGPLRTTDIHLLIHELHPDLCNDLVDRIIDGRRYGKKWKHAVRTAQQQMKRSGLVNFDGSLWHAT